MIKRRKQFLYSAGLIILLLTLASCDGNKLSVHSDYLSHETLASYYINTPDPLLNNPPIGQRLIISWSVPGRYTQYPDLHLWLTVRYRNREEAYKKISIKKSSGTYLYCLLNEEYCEKGGIATYKVQLKSADCLLEEWRHQLWAELILFEDNEF